MADSNSSFCYFPYSSAIAIATINAIFCALGIVGNSLVLIAVYRTMELRTLSNLYLVALAIADFVTSAIAQPVLIAVVVQQSQGKCNKTLETVFRSASNSSAASSFSILLFITTERLLAVLKPIQYKNFYPKRRFTVFISISVILPLVYTVLRLAVIEKVTSYFSAILFALGYIYIMVCYVIILLKLRKQSREMKKSTRVRQEDNTRSTRHAEKMVTSTMALVIVIFTIMWVPLFYCRITQPLNNRSEVYNWFRTTASSSSALNFIVYAFRMKRFRNAFKSILCDGIPSLFQSSTSSTANILTSGNTEPLQDVKIHNGKIPLSPAETSQGKLEV